MLKQIKSQPVTRASSPARRQFQYKEIENGRQIQLQLLTDRLDQNSLTYLKFGFKTQDLQENIYVKDFQKSINFQSTGSMSISDLWANKQISQYLQIEKLTKEKLMLKQLAKKQRRLIIKKRESSLQLQLQPVSPMRQSQSTLKLKASLNEIVTQINTIHQENVKLAQYMVRKRPHKANN